MPFPVPPLKTARCRVCRETDPSGSRFRPPEVPGRRPDPETQNGRDRQTRRTAPVPGTGIWSVRRNGAWLPDLHPHPAGCRLSGCFPGSDETVRPPSERGICSGDPPSAAGFPADPGPSCRLDPRVHENSTRLPPGCRTLIYCFYISIKIIYNLWYKSTYIYRICRWKYITILF